MSDTIDLNRAQMAKRSRAQETISKATTFPTGATLSAVPQSSGYSCHYIDGQTEQFISIDPIVTTEFKQSSQPLVRAEPIYLPAGAQLLLAAKQLRTQCFATSFGVVFNDDLDSDAYDEACLHIVLQKAGQVIATARVLDSQRAALLGHFYSEQEFHLAPLLKPYPYDILEVGRTCIHPEYRNGKVLRQLWQAITEVARHLRVNAFIGCCSISIGAGDINGWLQTLDVPKLTIRPKYQLPPSVLSSAPLVPPLLSTYLKMGASISEQACFDIDFHCADVLVWLPFEQVQPRYQHLLGGM